MKYIFIVNPAAGNVKKIISNKIIDKVCEKYGLDYKIIYTSKPKEATEISKNYQTSDCIIYSVGGDGTLLEIINGVADDNLKFQGKIGIIPAGSGNDFYRMIKNTENISNKKIDICKVNSHYFLNVASIGLDAEVVKNAQIMKKLKIPPTAIYNVSILYTFWKFHPVYLNYLINDTLKFSGRFTSMVICNGKYYGGGFPISKSSSIFDGILDAYFVSSMPKYKIPHLIWNVKKGTHEKLRYVNKIAIKSISIFSENEIFCNIDGEILSEKRLDISVIPDGITLYNNKYIVNDILDKTL